jgi:hypothetical protein
LSLHVSDSTSDMHAARRSASMPDGHCSGDSDAATWWPISLAQASRSPYARFVPTLLQAAWRSQRAIVTRITALETSTGAGAAGLDVAELLDVSFCRAEPAAVELVVRAALVVMVVDAGARADWRSRQPHAALVTAVASASTSVVPRIRRMIMTSSNLRLHSAHQLARRGLRSISRCRRYASRPFRPVEERGGDLGVRAKRGPGLLYPRSPAYDITTQSFEGRAPRWEGRPEARTAGRASEM